MPPVDVAFDRVSSFPGRRNKKPFVLRAGADANAGALHDFQKTLGIALQTAGLAVKVNSHFTPHVTLLYDERHLGALFVAIGMINLWNRVNVGTHQVAGSV